MNLGIVTTWFERGAAYVSKHYRDVLSGEINVYIYARPGSERLGDDSYRRDYVTWGRKTCIPLASAIDMDDFKKWIKDRQLDMVLFNEQHWWPPVLECSDLGVISGAYIDYYTDETVPLFANYDILICNTKRHYSAFEWHPQAHYVPWGTDVEIFKPGNLDPVNPGSVVFFHSCGFSPFRKGTDLILKAFDLIKGKARLVIHSQANLKKCIPGVAADIDRLTTQGRIEIVEKTVGAPGLYHLGDVYLYPSRLDGLGLTMAEALSCGLPLITSDNPPMNEFTEDSFCRRAKLARTFKRKDNYFWPMCEVDTEDLAACMQFYADHANNLGNYKRAAREHAVRNLDWRKNAAVLPGLLMNIRKLKITEDVRKKAMEYENSRLSFGIRLYRLSPSIFKILADLRSYFLSKSANPMLVR